MSRRHSSEELQPPPTPPFNIRGGGAATLVTALLFLLTSASFAGNAELLFEAGSRSYLNGDWDGALEKWRQVESSGYVGGALFYNLGNVYFKKGELGQAILYWEKAARLIGEDGDIAANLKIARARLTDKLDESVRLPVWDSFDQLRDRFSARFTAWLGVLLSFLTFGVPAGRRWLVRSGAWNLRLKGAAAVLAIVLALDLGMVALKARDEVARRQGVFVAPEAEVLSAPAVGSGKLLFTLHEGTKVRVLRSLEGWFEISAGKDKQGWVRSDALGLI